MADWTVANIPDQTGKRVVITGATSGLGYDTALVLAGAGAEVILTGRNDAKGAAALAGIKAQYPSANIRYENLNLTSLASVATFADNCAAQYSSVDVLVNNAGVMALPTRETTADGFEMQLGTNYLSHFALTGKLLPLLRAGKQPRVVNLSSIAHRRGAINFDDLQSAAPYKAWVAYQDSKLAMLIYALELQRRSDAGGWGLLSLAAHPGIATTNLAASGPFKSGNKFMMKVADIAMSLVGQSSAAGALPTLYAATSPEVKPGGYYGPQGFREMKGPPGVAKVAPQALTPETGPRLWDVSVELTGVSYLS